MKPDNILTIGYLSKHPENAARVLESLPPSMSADLLQQLEPEDYLPTFEHLIPSYAAKLIDRLEDETRNRLLHLLSTEKISITLSFFDDPVRKEILAGASPEKRKKIVSRMQYPGNTVGSIMKPPLFSLPQDVTVAEALKRIRLSKSTLYSEIIVLDKMMRYTGMVTLDKLIQAAPHKKVSSLVSKKYQALPARYSLTKIKDKPEWSYLRIMPVTDTQGVLVGVLDYSTLLQYFAMETYPDKPQPDYQLSFLEFLFQTLALPIEILICRLFPKNKTFPRRYSQNDNGI